VGVRDLRGRCLGIPCIVYMNRAKRFPLRAPWRISLHTAPSVCQEYYKCYVVFSPSC
jgi:hypothetical protein